MIMYLHFPCNEIILKNMYIINLIRTTMSLTQSTYFQIFYVIWIYNNILCDRDELDKTHGKKLFVDSEKYNAN